MNKGLVSIITPNYNGEKFIDKTIDSIINQEYENWELIIVDDCSKDNSINIVKKYMEKDKRIKLINNEKNEGAALSRNKAIEISNGEFIAFLDSDDLWKKQKLKKQIEFMRNNDVDFSYTEYDLIDEEGNSLKKEVRIPKNINYKKMLFHNYMGCLTVVYNQKKIGKIVGPNLPNTNDYALFLKVLKNVKNAKGLREVLGHYRIRKGSISRNKIKKIKPHFYLLNKIEKKNIIQSLFYILTHNIIKKIWKYREVK